MNSSNTSSSPAARLGPGVRWALAFSLVSSAAALLWPSQPLVGPVAARGSASDTTSSLAQERRPAPASTASNDIQRLPSELVHVVLDPSTFDPFVGAQPPPIAVAAPAAILAPLPAPPPPPPPLTYRFMGRMVDPSGQQQIYLSRSDSTVLAVAGTVLEDGYVVDEIAADAVVLRYAQTGTRVRLPVPISDELAGNQ